MCTELTHCWLTGICLDSIVSENSKHSGAWDPQTARGLSDLHGQRKRANCILHSHITSRQKLTIISTAVKSFGVEEGLVKVPEARVQAKLEWAGWTKAGLFSESLLSSLLNKICIPFLGEGQVSINSPECSGFCALRAKLLEEAEPRPALVQEEKEGLSLLQSSTSHSLQGLKTLI